MLLLSISRSFSIMAWTYSISPHPIDIQKERQNKENEIVPASGPLSSAVYNFDLGYQYNCFTTTPTPCRYSFG